MVDDLEKLKKTFDDIRIKYHIRSNGRYSYMFLGDRRDLFAIYNGKFLSFDDDDIDVLLLRHKFIEFEDGKLVSYFNS